MKTDLQQISSAGPDAKGTRVFGKKMTGFRAVLLIAGMLGTGDLRAQNGDATISTNEVQVADDSAAGDATQTTSDTLADDNGSTNSVAETNAPVTPGPDGRTRRLQRQRRPRTLRESSTNGAGSASLAGTNGTRSSLDYSAFRLVAERNIFDPNRTPRYNRGPVQQRTVDSFSLVGTMSYEKGDFAFFDGSSSDYKKVLKTNDLIAGYKILAISPEQVTVASGTNQIELRVGTQMRRGEDGHWERAASPAAYTASSSSSSSSEAPTSGAESDTIRKMMMRREKE